MYKRQYNYYNNASYFIIICPGAGPGEEAAASVRHAPVWFTSCLMICRLNTVNLSHHQTRSPRHSLHRSQGLLWRNLAGHVIIIGGILAVTLAGGGGGGLTVEQLFGVAQRQAARR